MGTRYNYPNPDLVEGPVEKIEDGNEYVRVSIREILLGMGVPFINGHLKALGLNPSDYMTYCYTMNELEREVTLVLRRIRHDTT